MTSATLDRLLAILVVAMAATGLLSLRIGSPDGSWVFVGHGVIGGCLAAAVALKLARSVPAAVRRGSPLRLAVGLAVALAAVAALGGGLAWVASGRRLEVGSWTVLTLHAWVGLVLVPMVIVHLLPRRWRLIRPGRLSAIRARGIRRRSVLAAGGLVAAGGFVAVVSNLLDRLNGGERRFTGSRELPAGGIPPTTTFFGEPTPVIDLTTWRVSVTGLVGRPGSWSLAQLAALGTIDLSAILDCTSGWWIETGWRGVPLRTVLEAAAVSPTSRLVTVRSVTGWSAELPLGEAAACLLATGVAGEPLPAGNGAPLRLVVPDRRGLDWVKWVDRIEVT
jgi:hypothetical protein